MTNEELWSRLIDLVMEYGYDEPPLDRILSARELAEGMGLTMAEVEQLAAAGSIPCGHMKPDGSWEFSAAAIMLHLAGPPPLEVTAALRAALAARPLSERVRRKWTVEDIARTWNVPPDHVRRLAEHGTLTGRRGPDGVWLFSDADLEDYAARREREA